MMVKRYFQNSVIRYFLFFMILAASGCDQIVYPRKIGKMPNTFAARAGNPWDKVLMIEVYENKDIHGEDTLVWKIKTTCEISARGFSVTVGQVPDGFEQIIPVPSEKFLPVPGKEYYILIHTTIINDRPTIFAGAIHWIAEPLYEYKPQK